MYNTQKGLINLLVACMALYAPIYFHDENDVMFVQCSSTVKSLLYYNNILISRIIPTTITLNNVYGGVRCISSLMGNTSADSVAARITIFYEATGSCESVGGYLIIIIDSNIIYE